MLLKGNRPLIHATTWTQKTSHTVGFHLHDIFEGAQISKLAIAWGWGEEDCLQRGTRESGGVTERFCTFEITETSVLSKVIQPCIYIDSLCFYINYTSVNLILKVRP